jgi:hypothetical protein
LAQLIPGKVLAIEHEAIEQGLLRDVAELHDDDGCTTSELGVTDQSHTQIGVILVTMPLAEADHVGLLPRGENPVHYATQVSCGLRAATVKRNKRKQQCDAAEKSPS